MTKRITKINPPRAWLLKYQDEVIDRLRTDPTTPLANVPQPLAGKIRVIAQLDLGGRCTFTRLVGALLTLPEFAWWARPNELSSQLGWTPEADDIALYRSTPVVTSDPREIMLMITEAIRQSPEWELLIVPADEITSQRLVFKRKP